MNHLSRRSYVERAAHRTYGHLPSSILAARAARLVERPYRPPIPPRPSCPLLTLASASASCSRVVSVLAAPSLETSGAAVRAGCAGRRAGSSRISILGYGRSTCALRKGREIPWSDSNRNLVNTKRTYGYAWMVSRSLHPAGTRPGASSRSASSWRYVVTVGIPRVVKPCITGSRRAN